MTRRNTNTHTLTMCHKLWLTTYSIRLWSMHAFKCRHTWLKSHIYHTEKYLFRRHERWCIECSVSSQRRFFFVSRLMSETQTMVLEKKSHQLFAQIERNLRLGAVCMCLYIQHHFPLLPFCLHITFSFITNIRLVFFSTSLHQFCFLSLASLYF